LAIDGWKFSQSTARAASRLDLTDRSRFVSQIRFFIGRIDLALASLGLRLVSLEGMRFDPGMPATALNMAEFDSSDELIVDQMIEPVVMGPDGVVRPGTTMLRRAS
jgi:hypothetical protein